MNKPKHRNDFLLRSLLHAVYWLDESLQQSLQASGLERIPRTWSLVLVNLADGVTRPTEMARNLGVSRQAVHMTLKDMQEAGLILMEQDPDDKRARVILFNSDAEDTRLAALEAFRNIETQLEKRIGAKQVQAMKKALLADWGPLIVSKVR